MSQESLEISRAYLDGISRASQEGLDPEATVAKLAEFWDPEIEWDMSESIVLDIGGVYRGIEAGQQLWREWFTAWETLQAEYELVDAGERVVWLIDLRMRGRSTGIEVPLGKHAFVNAFRDGLIVHSKLYMSQSEALEAVGLSEQEAPAQPSELALHMKRVLPASRPLVFNALTEPDELAKWWGPSGFTAPSVEVDLRAGGSYRIAMQPPDDELFFLSGEFLEVDPPARVAYTFRWEDPDPDDQETVVTLSLGDLGESTELVFTQRAFATEGRRALHEQGWTDGLNRLQELMSSAESGAASAS